MTDWCGQVAELFSARSSYIRNMNDTINQANDITMIAIAIHLRYDFALSICFSSHMITA